MKLFTKLSVIAFIMVIGTMTMAQSIVGSAHDFQADTWNPNGEICQACHTPHGANGAAGAPLWNHDETSTTFTLYTSSTLDATAGQPAGTSKLCLGCHDGSVGLGAFGGAADTTNFVTGNFNLGNDLSLHHPVSITYDTTLATNDGQLYNPATQNSGLGGTIQNDMLFSNNLECASCHDVHNSATGTSSLLVKSNDTSALCLTCHNK